MYEIDDDIIEQHHMVDNECPVTDQFKEDQLLKLTAQERQELDELNTMKHTAMDAYWKVLDEGGSTADAQEAFFEVQRNFYKTH